MEHSKAAQYWLRWGSAKGANPDPAPALPGMGLDAKCSGRYTAYCDVALDDGAESVRPEWGNSCGDGWDEVGDRVGGCAPGAGERSMF